MKNIINTLMGLSIICVLFSSCEAEKDIAKQEKLIVKPFSMKDVTAKSNTELNKTVNKIRSMNKLNTNGSDAKIVFDEKSGLYFDDQKGLYIEKDGLKSYTFPVLKTTADDKLKNICFNEKQNGSFDVYLIKYDLTKAESLTLTEQQKQAREKQFIPLIKDGVPLEELKMQCIDIYLTTTTEYVVPVDNGELTGNFGTTTVSHTTSVLIGSSCSIQGLSGGNQTGGNTTIASGGSGTGSGNNNPFQDGDIITGLNTRDLEGVLGDEELFFYNYTAFTSGLNAEQNSAFNAHPELMEYFIANGWSNENQGLVRTLIDKFQGNEYSEDQKQTLSQLISICAQHHATFDFSNSDSGQSMSVGEIGTGMNETTAPNNVFEIEDLPGDQNGFTGRCKVHLGVLSLRVAMNFSTDAHGKYTLKKENIQSELSGIVIFTDWTQLNNQCNVNNNSNGNIRIDLYGKLHEQFTIPSLQGINITQFYHIIIIVDRDSGSVISTEVYED